MLLKILVVTTAIMALGSGYPQDMYGGKYRGMYPPNPVKESREDASNFRVYSIQGPPPAPIDFESHNTVEEAPAPAPYSPPEPPAPVETEAPRRYPTPAPYQPPAPAPVTYQKPKPAPAPYKPPTPVSYGNEEPGMPYSFAWQVSDKASGNEYGQEEESNGENTKGSYSVLLPDGRTQKVTYKVDPGAGYTAEIAYEGEANFPAPAPYKPPMENPAEAPVEAPAETPELFYDPDSDAAINRYTFVDQPRSLF